MSVVGFQDYWVAGSTFVYRRDPIDGVDQPWIDLGTIQPANPTLELEKLELEDSRSGVKVSVDETVVKIDETYDITCSNMSLHNWSLLFFADPPTSFSQSATVKDVSHDVIASNLISLHDSDTDETSLYGLDAISGMYTGVIDNSTLTITDMVAATKVITVSGGDPTAIAGLANGKFFIVHFDGSMVEKANSRSYTVASTTATTITVVEAIAADETTITAGITYEDGGEVYEQGAAADWIPYDTEKGLAKIVSAAEGGSITTSTINIVFAIAALSGDRLINPQSGKGEVKGDGQIFWSRGNNLDQTVREARISITPSSANVQIDDYSDMVLTVKVLSDLQATDVAGRMLSFDGTIPTTS